MVITSCQAITIRFLAIRQCRLLRVMTICQKHNRMFDARSRGFICSAALRKNTTRMLTGLLHSVCVSHGRLNAVYEYESAVK